MNKYKQFNYKKGMCDLEKITYSFSYKSIVKPRNSWYNIIVEYNERKDVQCRNILLITIYTFKINRLDGKV